MEFIIFSILSLLLLNDNDSENNLKLFLTNPNLDIVDLKYINKL